MLRLMVIRKPNRANGRWQGCDNVALIYAVLAVQISAKRDVATGYCLYCEGVACYLLPMPKPAPIFEPHPNDTQYRYPVHSLIRFAYSSRSKLYVHPQRKCRTDAYTIKCTPIPNSRASIYKHVHTCDTYSAKPINRTLL